MIRKTLKATLIAATLGLMLSIVLPANSVFAQSHGKADSRKYQYPSIGREIRTLPKGNQTVLVNRKNYRYTNGSFYRPNNKGAYVVVRAPVGARVRTLPASRLNFRIGNRNYFFANLTYYLWDQGRSEYIVVDKPDGAESAMDSTQDTVTSPGNSIVYPSEGQSDEQRARDRYECYQWAVDETGYDPASGVNDSAASSDYTRANSACLEGRGYTLK